MGAILITICGLVILLAFEIRHRLVLEELSRLKLIAAALDEEIIKIKEQMKLKKNIYEES